MELSSYQLHWAPSLRAHSAAVLNLAPDHLDWHGSMEAYAADKGRIYEGNQVACVYNVGRQAATEDLVREADVEEGCRAIGFTLGTPAPSQLGVVDGILVDRAFVEDRQKNAQELAEVADVNPPAPHNIANALAAAALARAFGVSAAAVRDGLRAFTPDAHRIAHVADVDGVAYIDDSKATNTHAAEASLAAYESIVWIAGGLAKGATFDELVTGAAERLRGAVLIGADRALIREALARHAPEVPVVDLDRTDTGAMLAGGPGSAAARPARGHGAAGPGLCLDGHVHQLQQARRRVRGGRSRTRRLSPGRGPGAGRPRRDAGTVHAGVQRRRAMPGSPRAVPGRPPVQRAARQATPRRRGRAREPRTPPVHARAPGLGPAADRVLPDPRRQPADHRARPGDGLLGLPDHRAADCRCPARTSSASSSWPRVIGAGLLLAASRMPVKLHRALAYPILAGAVFLMALVQVPGIGVAVNGNQNWISLGGSFQIQPSEFGKLALVLWGADLLARKQDKRLLTQWKHMLVPLVPAAFLLLGLIMLGGDMGTAIILTAILFGLLWLAGAPTRLFAGVLSVAALHRLHPHQDQPQPHGPARLPRCHRPGPRRHCWQAVHGIYALASGGLFGSGLGASVEKWGQLPEAHTDFIFAVTGEELGLAGTLSVLALFAALGYAGIRVAGRTEDPFVRYAAGGVTTWITAQAVINIGAVLGLLPIAGVPLPLFSYGGSALLPTMFAIGLLIAFARDEPAARAALAMRQPALVESGRQGPGRAGPRRWNTMRRRASAARSSGER